MQDFEISLTIDLNHQMVEQAIDDAISATGLITTLRCTLKKYPECVHWHVKNGRKTGDTRNYLLANASKGLVYHSRWS